MQKETNQFRLEPGVTTGNVFASRRRHNIKWQSAMAPLIFPVRYGAVVGRSFRRRFCAVSLLLALVEPTIGSAATASNRCSRIGSTKVVSGARFACVKRGKTLVWVVSSKSTVASSSTTIAPGSTTSTTVASVSDSLNFKNRMIYGIKNARLTRRADSGAYFENDSRKAEVFSAIRQKAYSELNPSSLTLSHPSVEFIYDIRPSFPSFLIEFTKRELSASAALWNDFFRTKIQVRVTLATEKDRDYIRGNSWLEMNLPGSLRRFDAKNERPFITGGAGYWDEDGQWRGNIYLATASYLDLTYVNYEWPQVARHEFFHVVQDYAMFRTQRARPSTESEYNRIQPLHFREGGANAVSYLTAFGNLGWSSDAMSWLVWQRASDNRRWIDVKSVDDIYQMMIGTEQRLPNEAFEMSYSIGAVMYEWILGTYGLDGFIKILNQLATAKSFDEALQKSVGLTQNEFYVKSAGYVFSVFQSTWPYR